MIESCESCKYFFPTHCRKDPPQCFIVPDKEGTYKVVSGFPPVEPTNWCGSYEQKETSLLNDELDALQELGKKSRRKK